MYTPPAPLSSAVEQRRGGNTIKIAPARALILLLLEKHDVSDDSEEQQGGQGERVLQVVVLRRLLLRGLGGDRLGRSRTAG